MAALTAARLTDLKFVDRGLEQRFPVAASKIYKGGLVAINSAGFAKAAADAAGDKVVGVALEEVDNTGGAAGDKFVVVMTGVAAKLPATAITQAMVGTKMFVVDDQTFDDATGVNSVDAGVLIEFVSATEGWVFIPPFFVNLF